MTAIATATPGKTLLNGADHTLIMIDHQSQMAFATKSIATELLRNNAALVANAAAGFNVSTILTKLQAGDRANMIIRARDAGFGRSG